MPKKNKPKTTLPKNKKTVRKPKVKSIMSTRPVIYKVQPCCTDVLKTGQALTVPFGYSDYKGTQRLQTPLVQPSADETFRQNQIKPTIAKKEYNANKIMSLITTQPVEMGEPSITPVNKKISIVNQKENDINKIMSLIKTQPVEMGEPSTTPVNKKISIVNPMKDLVEPTPIPAKPRPINLLRPIPSNAPEVVREAVSTMPKPPRKNSRAELENRYEAITGSRYSGIQLDYSQFRKMVEGLNSKSKKNI